MIRAMSMSSSQSLDHTARLALRPVVVTDAPALMAWLSDTEVTAGRPEAAAPTLAGVERQLDDWVNSYGRSSMYFTIERRPEPVAIGIVGLQRIDRVNGSAAIDILIGDRAAWGRGLGREALTAALRIGFTELRLHRIWLLVYAYNERAIRAYERLGFQHEGRFRDGVFRHGAYHDVLEMAILASEWQDADAHA
jgi:RimJ/RimL family protein N-acetyltransferase